MQTYYTVRACNKFNIFLAAMIRSPVVRYFFDAHLYT